MKQKNNFRWGYYILIAFGVIFLAFISLFFIGVIALLVGTDAEPLGGNIALISIDGIILGSKDSDYLFESVASSEDITELIEKADENSGIKAIILKINSPGGSAVASEEIANAVSKTNKTTVAWIREVGASGAYWVASASDHIVASRMSVTGSIGVIASYLEFPGFLERYNVTYRRLVAGKYKDIGSPFKEMTGEEQEFFQKTLDDMRDHFVSEVAKNRQMSKKDVDKAANGLFYLGSQAKELNLIDEIGSKEEVIRYIEQKEGIKADIVEYKKEEGLLELLSGVTSKQSFFIGRGIGSAIFAQRSTPTITT